MGKRPKLEGETENKAFVRKSGRGLESVEEISAAVSKPRPRSVWLRMHIVKITLGTTVRREKGGFYGAGFLFEEPNPTIIENTARRHKRGGRSEVTVTSEPHT